MRNYLRQLLSLFNRRESWQLSLLSVALVIRAVVELVGVASIAPFMAVVADPGEIHSNKYLAWAYEQFHFDSTSAFLTTFGIVVVVLLVFCNSFSALTQWALLRFSWNSNHRLSMRLLAGYLGQPYGFFTQSNTANLSTNILAEVQQAIQGVLIPALMVLSRSPVVLALVGLLIAVDPKLAAIIIVVLGGSYIGLYTLIRNRQLALGRQRADANKQRYRVTSEAFGGIKDVKVLGREQEFLRRFQPASWNFTTATCSNTLFGQLPRYLFEAIAFGGLVLIVVFYLQAGKAIGSILPAISLYAFAGYRLMPELQQMFAAFATWRFNQAALDNLLEDIRQFPQANEPLSPGGEGRVRGQKSSSPPQGERLGEGEEVVSGPANEKLLSTPGGEVR